MKLRDKKKLIGVYKRCINVLTRGYSLPLRGGSERKNGTYTPVKPIANSTYNYIGKVKRMILDLG